MLSVPTHASSIRIGRMVPTGVPWYLPVSSLRSSHRFVMRLRLLRSCCTQYSASVLVVGLGVGRLAHVGHARGPLVLRREAWIRILVQARHQSLLWSDAAAVFVRKLLGVQGALLIFCQTFTAVVVVLASVKVHQGLLLLYSVNDLWHCVQILWLQRFWLYRSVFLSFGHGSRILVSDILVARVHEGSLFDALRCLARVRIVQSIKRTVEELCLLFSIVWSSCSDASHEILRNLVLSEYWIVIFPIDNWFWMVRAFSLILALQNVSGAIMGWLRAVSLKISLIEFVMWDSIALRRPVESSGLGGWILFAVLIHALNSSSTWLLCLYRSRKVSIGSFLPRVRGSISIKLRWILLIIAGLFNILWRRSSRAPKPLRRRGAIIICRTDIVDDVFESPSGILLGCVLRCQPTGGFTLRHLSLFQFCQVGFLI